MIGLVLKAGKRRILAVTLALTIVTALLDWLVGTNVSLAALYILPMMAGAVVLRPFESAIFALVCSYLRSRFEHDGTLSEQVIRYVFAALSYFLSGLFVTVLIRNHELVSKHLKKLEVEQALRREAEEHLRLLAASSPAAILTTDHEGLVLSANQAAENLFHIPAGETLRGRSMRKYVPVLTEALAVDVGPEGLRTDMQCQGSRDDGEIFQAHIWFSCYSTHEGRRLAAIMVDSSEEMRDREEQGLQQLMRGNRIAAAAVAHEVRNFCVAMRLLCSNLQQRSSGGEDQDVTGLANLLSGLETIASFELESRSQERLQHVPLREVLDVLRIVIEPAWHDIEGSIVWNLPSELPLVVAEPRGLLQAFLNLAQNSHRAVQETGRRELHISAAAGTKAMTVRFADCGPGIASPERLFQPFQEGSAGSGLGLYVSRFIVRSYGGELRYEPGSSGACFAVELMTVSS